MVISLDDIPMWIIHKQDIENNQSTFFPGFGAVRCWNKPSFAIPFIGTNNHFDINDVLKDIHVGKTVIPLHKRKNKLIFRGTHKGCSYEKDTIINFNYDKAFTTHSFTTLCGRNLLMNISQQYPNHIDYTHSYISMIEQEEKFKYGLSIEGFGGWADRLYYLLFSNMITFNQNHPCDQWFEPLLHPYEHFIPVHHDFRDIIGKILWANQHPHTIEGWN